MSTSSRVLRYRWAIFGVCVGAIMLTRVGGARAEDHDFTLQLVSSTFVSNGTLPLITIDNFPGANGANICTPDGQVGENESPELSWSHVPEDTRTFVVVMYDVTASFTHWGMYNIPASTRSLPLNAGIAGSAFGSQVANDFGDLSYDGPCPPATVNPVVHQYVVTVYALDRSLQIPAHGDFPAGSEALYHALLDAGRHDHVLASASITGLFSSVAGAATAQ